MIVGWQNRLKESDPNPYALYDAFKVAHADFIDHGCTPMGWDSARRLNSLLCILVGGEHEDILNKNLQSFVISGGEAMACDEKVVTYDDPQFSIIRVVPAKNVAGLWMFTCVVWSEHGLPYLVYS